MNHFPEFSSFKNKIDLICGKFETIHLRRMSRNTLIFINFEEIFKPEEILIFPKKFHQIMKKALALTENIALLFPSNLQISNLAPFYCDQLEIYKEWYKN